MAAYEHIFSLMLDKSVRNKYGRFSADAKRALAEVPRHNFFTQRMLREIAKSGKSPEQAARNPMEAFFLGERSMMALPPSSAGFMSILGITQGYNVLEIGTGSGYDAALLASAVGERGHVTTLEINEYLVDHAREALRRSGISNVTVVNENGIHGYEQNAPYDAIVVDGLGNYDPTPMLEQLRVGGKMTCTLPYWTTSSGVKVNEPIMLLEKAAEDRIVGELLVSYELDGV